MFTLRPERPDDGPAIEALLDICFGPGRFAKTAYRLREGVGPVAVLSTVAEEDGVSVQLDRPGGTGYGKIGQFSSGFSRDLQGSSWPVPR